MRERDRKREKERKGESDRKKQRERKRASERAREGPPRGRSLGRVYGEAGRGYVR